MEGYTINEVNGSLVFTGKTGIPLISFETGNSEFAATFHNYNIDIVGEPWSHLTEKYGDTFRMSIVCRSEEELAQCQSRYKELALNGFTTEFRKYIAMDWEDLEFVAFSHPHGYYYSAPYDSDDADSVSNALIKAITKDCKKAFSVLVCVEGNDLRVFEKMVSPFESIVDDEGGCIIQFLCNDNENERRVDVWVFTEE